MIWAWIGIRRASRRSVIGALKRGLAPMQDELGLYVCGGRGKHSRKTPDELQALGNRTGIDGDGLTRASRLVAKVDSAAVQDGFDLYLHGFFVTAAGTWTVVQQGMNGDKKAGSPVPLAFPSAAELCRRTSQCDRRTGAGRDCQPDRSPRRELAQGADAVAGRHRSRPDRSGV